MNRVLRGLVRRAGSEPGFEPWRADKGLRSARAGVQKLLQPTGYDQTEPAHQAMNSSFAAWAAWRLRFG